MADKREYAIRISMILLAVLFLVTSVGLSIFVIVQARQQKDAEKTATSQTTTDSSKTTPEEGKLEGTQLANFTPSTEPVTELQITDPVEGTGEVVKEGATITAHYTGALVSNGIIFQSSHDTGQPFTSALSGLIQGWQKGIPGMKVGGTRRLVIPYAQAYGEAGSPPSIPAKADLVFDIELVSVQNP